MVVRIQRNEARVAKRRPRASPWSWIVRPGRTERAGVRDPPEAKRDGREDAAERKVRTAVAREAASRASGRSLRARIAPAPMKGTATARASAQAFPSI